MREKPGDPGPVATMPRRATLLAVWLMVVFAVPVYGQVSPEEHAKHHAGQATGKAWACRPLAPRQE